MGAERRHWSLHQNLLCHHSDYFEDHCTKDGKKTNGKVELPDDDPRAFELLVKWLYQGKIDDVADMSLEKKWEYADTYVLWVPSCRFQSRVGETFSRIRPYSSNLSQSIRY